LCPGKLDHLNISYSATATIESVTVTKSVATITIPEWKTSNPDEQAKWDKESDTLESHEKDHHPIATDGILNVLKPALESLDQPTGTGTGATAQEARNNAVQDAYDRVIQPAIDKARDEIQKKQNDLDDKTYPKRIREQ
jgi:predicted secreted Zn-dependent protease